MEETKKPTNWYMFYDSVTGSTTVVPQGEVPTHQAHNCTFVGYRVNPPIAEQARTTAPPERIKDIGQPAPEGMNYAMAVVAKLADRDPKSVLQHCTKASEELGELSEAVLAFTGAPGMAYKNLAPEAVLEETADLVMVATSVALKAGFSIDDLTNAMLEKSRKWEAVLDGKKPASGKERSAFLLDFAFGDLPDSWTTCCPDCNVMDPPYEDTGLYRRCGCCNSLSRVATWLASSKDLGFSVEA